MLYSMTGFGRALAETPDRKIIVEIKSLNSKQMDFTLRLPHLLRDADPDIRNMVSHTLQRGKVDMVVTAEATSASALAKLNVPAIKAYKENIEAMAAELGLPQPDDWYGVLMRLPDAMQSDVSTEASETETAALLEASRQAVDALMRHRRAEGLKLEEFFATRIANIKALLEQIPHFEEERLVRIRARIEENLSKLPRAEFDHGRFEQEMIFYIEKLDINEEKQRLSQHLQYFLETMDAPEGGQGKKLGFISQEMGREINTLGSKSNHAEMQKIVVKMKDELEQIKEQVLNVM